jgi:hypothetical protein
MLSPRLLGTLGLTAFALAAAAIGAAPAFASLPSVSVATTGTDAPTCGSPASPCKTISYALGLAASGATVHVAAGTYNEQLVISHPVSIVGAGAGHTIIQPSALPTAATDSDSAQPQLAIVDVTPGTTSVSLSSLTVDGSAASTLFNATGCASDYVGVYYHDASGSLSNVAVSNIELPVSLFGCQDGLGIYVATDAGSTTPSHVTMTGLSVTAYDKNGITCDDLGTVCTIASSQVAGIGATPLIAQNGIQIYAASATIAGNSVTGNSYTDPSYTGPGTYYTESTGILVIDAGGLQVTGNTVTGNDGNIYALEDTGGVATAGIPTPGSWLIAGNNASRAVNNSGTSPGSLKVPFGAGIGDGIDVDSTSAPVSVTGNAVANDPEFGIALYGVTGASVQLNAAHGDGDGLYVGGPGTVGAASSHDSFRLNSWTGNQQDGIFADTTTSGLAFTGNLATGNGTLDVLDASTGSGTAGTANSWIATVCSTSSPTAICSHGGFRGPLPPIVRLWITLRGFHWDLHH